MAVLEEIVELVSGSVVETKQRSGSLLVLDGLFLVELEDVGDLCLGFGLHLQGLFVLLQLGLILLLLVSLLLVGLDDDGFLLCLLPPVHHLLLLPLSGLVVVAQLLLDIELDLPYFLGLELREVKTESIGSDFLEWFLLDDLHDPHKFLLRQCFHKFRNV